MPGLARLTERQRLLARLTAAGLADKEIAHRMGITEGSVKENAFRLRRKLGLDNKVQLAVWWVRCGEREEACGG